jgi:hypothetical protein
MGLPWRRIVCDCVPALSTSDGTQYAAMPIHMVVTGDGESGLESEEGT